MRIIHTLSENIISTRYENLNINAFSVFGYLMVPLVWSDYPTCEHEMKSTKLAFAAVFNRAYSTCNVYVNLLYEFPVKIQIVETFQAVTTFVKTAGHTGKYSIFCI